MYFLRSVVWSLLSGAAVAYPPLLQNRQNVGPGPVSGDTFWHDPTVIKKPGGGYLAAFTADNIGLKTSTDRTVWRDAGAAFPNGAPWTEPFTGKGQRNLWAPDLSFHNNQYYMYYSASSFGTTKSAIFLATSPTGASGSWTDHGIVVESNAKSDFNAIDPNLVVDAQGRWFLSFGSFWSGIKMVALDPATGKRSDSRPLINLASRPNNGGACCQGAQSTYRIMVGRSNSVTGPFLDKAGVDMMKGGGTQMMSSHGAVHGPGHNAVFTDSDADVLAYHYYNNAGTAQIGLNLLRYDGGWPVIY
ncbi:arabinan endo-1 5-alpha-L-arabinosidase [Apiospora rasikravindrae]|uniref:arabinan endo-1,5-alpha-L-arabinosidase n=1 Tax=Apiospora rasikravindrae TaxID=990691 RepID=A0ABR1TDZ9_9PEZI